MKVLQQITDEDDITLEGFMEHNGHKAVKVGVNVEKIWKDVDNFNKKVNKFIKEFISTYIHEWLHFILIKNYKQHPKWVLGEEIVIWSLLNEKMPKSVKKYYINRYKQEGDKHTVSTKYRHRIQTERLTEEEK